MSNHNVTVDSDGQNGENGNCHETISKERKETTKCVTVDPASIPKHACGQGQVETAEHQVTGLEIDDKVGGCVLHLVLVNNQI